MTRDDIELTIPADLRDVASLVLGGVGTRLDLPYERMDDLQLAVLSVVDAAAAGDVTIRMTAEDGRLAVAVGPLPVEAESDDALARVVHALADSFHTERRSDGSWAVLSVERRQAAAPLGP